MYKVEDREVSLEKGKYSGKSIEQVLKQDQDYFKRLLSNDNLDRKDKAITQLILLGQGSKEIAKLSHL